MVSPDLPATSPRVNSTGAQTRANATPLHLNMNLQSHSMHTSLHKTCELLQCKKDTKALVGDF